MKNSHSGHLEMKKLVEMGTGGNTLPDIPTPMTALSALRKNTYQAKK
jgi:hypothetical protein